METIDIILMTENKKEKKNLYEQFLQKFGKMEFDVEAVQFHLFLTKWAEKQEFSFKVEALPFISYQQMITLPAFREGSMLIDQVFQIDENNNRYYIPIKEIADKKDFINLLNKVKNETSNSNGSNPFKGKTN